MLNTLKRARRVTKTEGLSSLCKKTPRYIYYRSIFPRLPRTTNTLNSVTTRSARWFEDYIPGRLGPPNPEQYEEAIVNSLINHTKKGDHIVIVGGGWGVTTTVAAKQTGHEGSVTTFEASPESVTYTTETTQLNDVHDIVTVTNAVVSEPISVRGNISTDTIIQPPSLPDCDILELDCEGAELSILRDLEIRPRVIIVESHGQHDASSNAVIQELRDLSYEVESREPAESGVNREFCERHDIMVITATRPRNLRTPNDWN